jgi:uncharacterized membrane protein
VNRDEAKAILLLYRHGTADAEDPQIAEALAMARQDEVLARWLEMHCAKQVVLSEKLRQIKAPAGLKEQIVSEQAASEKVVSVWQRKISLVPVVVIIFLTCALAAIWISGRGEDSTLAAFKTHMAGVALRGYAMDLMTNDPAQIRAYLSQNHAPADFVLPEQLKRVSLTGCAVEGWQDVKVSMVCFRSRQAAPDVTSDIWLFVVNRSSVKKLPKTNKLVVANVNRLMTATWTDGDKLYFLGTTGNEQTLRQYL